MPAASRSPAKSRSTRTTRSSAEPISPPVKTVTLSSSSSNGSVVGAGGRPPLPRDCANEFLPDHEVAVKRQVIRREGQNIIIARVKLPSSPTDHAFLLKRFDSNAVAASAMFRIAFPTADGEMERAEMAYLERTYDCENANGGSSKSPGRGIRLAGVWMPADDALAVAEEYGLTRFVEPLVRAGPEEDKLREKEKEAVSTPARSKRLRVTEAIDSPAQAAAAISTASPSRVEKLETTVVRVEETTSAETKPSGTVSTTATVVSSTDADGRPAQLTDAEIEARIKEAKDIVKKVQQEGGDAGTATSTLDASAAGKGRGTKRSTQTVAAEDAAEDERERREEQQVARQWAATRVLRRAGKAARERRGVVTLGAAAAVAAAGFAVSQLGGQFPFDVSQLGAQIGGFFF